MSKLDRELTEKLFNCSTVDDVVTVVNEANVAGKDLETASRISIDEVLNKFYHKRCTGTKKHAVKMLQGAVLGEDIPDIPTTPSLSVSGTTSFDQYVEIAKMDPEERKSKIRSRVSILVDNAPDNFIMLSAIKKDAEFKSLAVTEDDMKTMFLDHPEVVIGVNSRGKLYAMRRDPQIMKTLTDKWGDTYFI